MKVKCIAINSHGSLSIGKIYTVYGLGFVRNSPVYYIRSEDDEISPYPYNANFFELKDRRLSSYWRWYVQANVDGQLTCYLVFPEWGCDHIFYENLIDGDPEAEAIFGKYKKLMDDEFSN